MKIIKFKMFGYKRLIPGFGKDSIEIVFKNKNVISIINGPNGIGKSTILNAMTPLPDSTDNFVDGKSAGKEFIYDNGYIIQIINECKNGNRQTSKAFIIKNGVQLNPTGNISSYKDLLFTEFGLDPCYIPLTALSSTDKGIATKTPAMRKKYFNGLLSDIDVYNDINKTMVKRSTIFKSMINNLTSKINSIGDYTKLESLLQGTQKELNDLEVSKNNIIKHIADSESKINSLDPNGEIQNEYNSILKEIELSNIEKSKLEDSIKEKSNNIFELELEDLQEKKSILCKEVLKIEMEKDVLTPKINTLLNNQQAQLEFLQTKVARLNTLKADVDFDTLKKELEDIEKQMKELDKDISSANVSPSQFYKLQTNLESILEQFYLLKEENYIYQSIDISYEEILAGIKNKESRIEKEEKLLEVANKGYIEQEIASRLLKIGEKIPNYCNCPLYKDLVEIPKMATSGNTLNRENIINSIKKYKEEIEEYKSIKSTKGQVIALCKKYSELLNLNIDIVLAKYKNNYSNANFYEEIKSQILYFQELENKRILLDNLKLQYSEKKSIYDIYLNKLDMITDVENDIKIIEDTLSNIKDDIDESNNKLQKLDISLIQLNNSIKDISSMISVKETIRNIQKSINSNLQRISILNESMKDIDEALKDISIRNEHLNSIYESIKQKTADRDRLTYSISMLKEYNDELQVYKEKFDLIETIKYYSSPTTGIQTLFMKLYMNNTLNICNSILGLMFNGDIILDEYVINENEFRIPCINNNMMIDDVSSMSSSQVSMISMIISMVLLKQSSSKYTIVRLDEIDAGLDTENRIKFVNICMKLIDILELDQVIMISHNMMELNSVNVDLIELS